jgi:cytochrome c peroxidase
MGSDLFPLTLLQKLKTKEGKPFLENMERFGFIPDPGSPEGLPIGLTVNRTPRGFPFPIAMVGVNCAACHVGLVTYKGKSVRVDGAPNLFDLNAFYTELFDTAQANVGTMVAFLGQAAEDPGAVVDESAADVLAKLVPILEKAREDLTEDEKAVRDRLEKLLSGLAATAAGNQQAPMSFPDLLTKVRSEFREDVNTVSQAVRKAAESGSESLKGIALDADELGAKLSTVAASVIDLKEQSEKTASEPAAGAAAAPGDPRPRTGPISETLLDVALLKARLRYLKSLKTLHELETSKPGQIPIPGPGRIDAFSGIRDLVFSNDIIDPTSPVSYPPMWMVQQTWWYHWDGNTNSLLQRNVGQAVGMGAVYDPKTYRSAVRAGALGQLEHVLWKLQSPRWPAELGDFRTESVEKGASVYRQHCAACHVIPPADFAKLVAAKSEDDLSKITALDDVGTDANRINNYKIRVGRDPQTKEGGEDFTVALHDVATKLTNAALADSELTEAEQKALERPEVEWRTTNGYVARPLVGVWATAPYLHNGSVPTLWDLLEKPADRPAKFIVGHREFDPERVGYVTEVEKIPESIRGKPPLLEFDTSIPGNSRQGHLYGTDLPPESKRDLIEFLKTL